MCIRDRLVGYQVSPALSHQTGIARLSAGRVQSVALRLVVDRQREIEAFKETKQDVYKRQVYDSAGVERTFAEQLEKNEAVKVYAKLPGWFKVPTPLGTYNPDWAVLVEKGGVERLYFVVETKSSLFTDDLRDKESAKIECGKAHFNALAVGENPAQFVTARNIDDLMAQV